MKIKPPKTRQTVLSVIEVFDKYFLVYYGKLVFVESHCSSDSNQYSGGEKVSSKNIIPLNFNKNPAKLSKKASLHGLKS